MSAQQAEAVLPVEEDGEEIVQVSNMSQFIALMQDWHATQVATVHHFTEMPSGVEVQVEGEEPFELEGDTLKGFKLGINMALSYLGELPFYAQGSANATQH